jgi:hypothetical protein
VPGHETHKQWWLGPPQAKVLNLFGLTAEADGGNKKEPTMMMCDAA